MNTAVIIVNWNGEKLLRECLNHLARQTVKPSNVFVVDNASSDNSVEIIEEFQFVTLMKMDQNLGFAAGNNRALERCQGEFVALLNPDAYPEPDWLKNLLEAAQDYPESAAFGSRQLNNSNNQILDGTGDCYHFSGLVWRDRFGIQQTESDLVSREIFSPCAAAALYRRQALVDAGYFDEDYFCYVEDADLGFRLRLAGHQSRYVPNAVVRHVGSATTGGQQSDFSVYHGHRNLVWTFVKNMPGYLFWLLLPAHIALNVFSLIWFALRGKGRIILQAKIDALVGLPTALRKREVVQKKRVVRIHTIFEALDKRLFKFRN